AWRCANIATLSKEVKYWIDDGIDLTKCSSCELQAFIQKSLSTMEFEYEFPLSVIAMIIILWLTDVNQKDHVRRTLVVTTIHNWFLQPTSISDSQHSLSHGLSTSTIDYYTTKGYGEVVSDSWETAWASIFSAVMQALMHQEEYTLDVNALRIDWL
ncbi:hypothetical protein FOL47_006202, partial [Perkinsus chesapeaki]